MPTKPQRKHVNDFEQRNESKTDLMLNEIIRILEESPKNLDFPEIFSSLKPLLSTHKTFVTISEENLKLRVYERLQKLVQKGFAIRAADRKYGKTAKILQALTPKATSRPPK